MIESTVNFYRNTLSHSFTYANGLIAPSPLTRIDFMVGAGMSASFLIYTVARSIFSLIANIFTLFCSQDLRSSFLQHLKEIPTYILGIPLGYAGVLFPDVINRSVLHISEDAAPTVNHNAVRV